MYKFGEIYLAKLPIQPDSRVQQGFRPVLVVSNDKNNYLNILFNLLNITSTFLFSVVIILNLQLLE